MSAAKPCAAFVALLFLGSLAGRLLAADPAESQVVVRITMIEVPHAEKSKDEKSVAERLSLGRPHVTGDARVLKRILDLLADGEGAKTLAAPTLTTLNEREATLHSGGEFFVPVLGPDGRWGREAHPFGTIVQLTPTLGEDSLRLELDAKIVERDFANSVTINGEKIPGLRIQAQSVDAKLKPGQAVLTVSELEGSTRLLLVHPEIVKTLN